MIKTFYFVWCSVACVRMFGAQSQGLAFGLAHIENEHDLTNDLEMRKGKTNNNNLF